ncbi:replication/maintenance protein RepL [Vogesella sp. XCS3]|uniref:replication/maintenance protein RepL n=1 Tax=Vogesella sp. XCS3 TaxID=2877939 RepID=UPI001D09FA3A|nr:replication/maintenance protein RepL [Vogesella sp. XCS3]UDM18133.1 replication/maintenance protein RepL [Vogesella sp. XCS3]
MNKSSWPIASICSYPACLQQEHIPAPCLQQFRQPGAGIDKAACLAALVSHLQTEQTRCQVALFDGDLVKAYLLSEISSRHPVAQARHGLAAEGYAFSNIHSLAEATSYPRETVRRKILQLIASGWVTRLTNGGLLLNPTRQPEYHKLLLEQARLVAITANKLRILQTAGVSDKR